MSYFLPPFLLSAERVFSKRTPPSSSAQHGHCPCQGKTGSGGGHLAGSLTPLWDRDGV